MNTSPTPPPLLAEILTLRKGLILAKHHNLKPLIIHTDCIAIIDMLKKDQPLYSNILSDYRSLLMEVEAAAFVHMFREQNQVADLFS